MLHAVDTRALCRLRQSSFLARGSTSGIGSVPAQLLLEVLDVEVGQEGASQPFQLEAT